MEWDKLERMIADLESFGAAENLPDSSSTPQIRELGADFLIASSPRREAPEGLFDAVLSRIDAEPPRVRTDATGRVVEINPAFSGLCGYSFQEIRGRKPGSLLQGPDTEAECIEVIREAVRRGEGCTTEMINYHKDGSRYRVKIEIVPLRGPDGVLTGFQATETKL